MEILTKVPPADEFLDLSFQLPALFSVVPTLPVEAPVFRLICQRLGVAHRVGFFEQTFSPYMKEYVCLRCIQGW